jgi:hypothetical protein
MLLSSTDSYKGMLTWDDEIQGYVLTADYSRRHPTAIIKGISSKSADVLKLHLERETNFDRMTGVDKTDEDLHRLLDRMTEHGAVLY